MKLFQRKPDDTASRLANEITTVERVMAQGTSTTPPPFGAPSRCPDCGEWGLVDVVRAGEAVNHCYRCHAAWTITVRALRAVAASIGSTPEPELVVAPGEGVLFPAADEVVDLRILPPFRSWGTAQMRIVTS